MKKIINNDSGGGLYVRYFESAVFLSALIFV